jgi:Cu/Ag efflux protein CusF
LSSGKAQFAGGSCSGDIAVVTNFEEDGMTIQFSVASKLTLMLAWMPALALAGQNTQPAQTTQPPAVVDPIIVVAGASEEATKPASSKGLVAGKGVVLKVNRDNATVKIDHDPIPALDWPRMTMPFRLKESALADQVKEGDKVGFFLEKSGSDYVIVKWQK